MNAKTLIPTLMALWLLPLAITAQGQSEGAINATGSSVIKRRPELMRMNVDVVVSDKTLKGALAKVETKRNGLRKQLADLGAVADSIRFSEVRMAGGPGDR